MSASKRLRVLLVEDDPDDEELVILELRTGGYEVAHERVDTEPAMQEALARQRWDIVLSDYSMPQFSGPKALKLLRDSGLDLPFIIISGTVGEETAVAAMRGGANDYVLKSSLARLCPAIDRELREAAVRAEQAKMREQLLISDRMASVGVLAAGVAHEINNPLSAIIANLDLIASDIEKISAIQPLSKTIQDICAEIHDAREGSECLRHIVRDLKLFSRPAAEERTGPVDVSHVLESSLRMAWNEIRHRAKLVKEYGDVSPVEANEARLGQVFLNLIVNASQAIREGDAENNLIHISTKPDPPSGFIAVEIRDTGSGIPPQNLAKIFDAFFTTKPIGVGTGLGLSICHSLISSLGGKIEVESKVGEGSIFRVLLPPSARTEHKKSPTFSNIPAIRRKQILVIDDEAIITRAIGRSLESEHDVVVSTNAGNALDQLRAGKRFDVILCDLMMPQITGMKFYAMLKETVPEQAERIVFMTGGAFTPEARSFLDAHPNRRIEKPFDLKQIRSIINESVD